MTTTLSVRIDSDTKNQLEALAKRARRSKSFLAAEAIAAYVEAERWQLDGGLLSERRLVYFLSGAPTMVTSAGQSACETVGRG